MKDLSSFNPNAITNPNNNIFGLPTREDDARLIILPVPWEVTSSFGTTTARAPNTILRESHKIELLDSDFGDAWRQGFYMREADKKVLLKSDYLRKEAELYISYVADGESLDANKFMAKTLREVNEGSVFLNEWVYKQTILLLNKNKLVGLLGGEHSIVLGFLKAIAEKEGDFGILQIDAHCDLRKSYIDFKYSHASIMHNVMEEIAEVKKLVQVGIRDYCEEEQAYISSNRDRIIAFPAMQVKDRVFEGETWKSITDEIISFLPAKVYISFDVDGLDEKLCPNTAAPVQGGFEIAEVFYLLKKIVQSGRRVVGFDLSEIGMSRNCWDENVGARILFKLCNLMIAANPK